MKTDRRRKVKLTNGILWTRYLKILGILSTIVTLFAFFLSPKDFPIKIWEDVVIFLAIIFLIFFIMWTRANKTKSAKLKINDTIVKIGEGDIFESLKKPPEARNDTINVIGVNDYYDMVADDQIIAKKSLHGQYIMQLKEDDLNRLNQLIKEDKILNKNDNFEETDRKIENGKKVRYKIGSLIEFESYVLAVFTKFDEDNMAYLSAEEYMDFWMKFWNNIDRIYAGRSINIPLMGAGITRFRDGKPSKQELLEIMLWTLKVSGFHNTYSDGKINIIIYKLDINDIDFYRIQYGQIF